MSSNLLQGSVGAIAERKIVMALVEDDDVDVELVQMALKDSPYVQRLLVFRDGEQARDYIRSDSYTKKNAPFSEHDGSSVMPQADLFLIDYNLPRINGRELISHVRRTAVYRHTPVIMHSTSYHPDEVASCYREGANACVQKRMDYSESRDMLQDMVCFWARWFIRVN